MCGYRLLFYVWVFEGTLPKFHATKKQELQGGTTAIFLLDFLFEKGTLYFRDLFTFVEVRLR